MAGFVSENRLKALSTKYKACRNVRVCECAYNHNCYNCQHCLTEDGWGSGDTPDICLAHLIGKEI